MAREVLDGLGAHAVPGRVVERGKVITAAGVSAGIDMALLLAGRIAGEETAKAIQLAIEYDPEPPFDAGSPEKAGAEICDRVAGVLTQMEGAPS
jgi:transcriptional regulator GlxA family with amidase domain